MSKVMVPFSCVTRCSVGEKVFLPGFYSCKCVLQPFADDRKIELGLFENFNISGGKQIAAMVWARLRAWYAGLAWQHGWREA